MISYFIMVVKRFNGVMVSNLKWVLDQLVNIGF